MSDSRHSDARFHDQDRNFVALVDGAFADAARRSGPHLLCRPGCSQCCVGVFAIGPADRLRAEQGLALLERDDPERAGRVRTRAAASWKRLASEFPGNPLSGALTLDNQGELPDRFEEFANHEPCPALDPILGTCDLYAARPYTCRVFGPPIATPEGYGVCELCFREAAPQEVVAAAITPEPEGLSETLDQAALAAGIPSDSTILAFVLKS